MSNDSAAEDEPVSADEDAEPSEDDVEGLEEGDVIKLAYTARTVEDGHLVDTTDAEVAEEEGVGEEQEFAPRTIALGQGHIFETVEADIIGKSPGETGTVVVPSEEAFGEFDEDEVRTVASDKIPEDDRYPGAQVQIGQEEGIVETIVGGRARVDFNHPLAGEDVEYEYEVLEEVEDREERAQGMLSMFLDMDLELWFQTDTVEEEQRVEPDEEDEEDEAADADEEPPEPEFETVEVEKESLYIEAIPQLQMNQQWMMQKQQIAQQLMDLVDVDRVVIQETIDGAGMGMPGMMGGMGGMGGGGDIEAALEEADIDADDLDMEDVEDVADEIEDAQ